MQQKRNKKSGFTLIELMVAMSIIAILAVTAIVNFGKNEDRDVKMEKDRLTSFLRDVQNKSLAVEKQGLPAGVKICGFGARMNGSNIESFYVSAPSLDASCTSNWRTYYTTNTTVLNTFHPSDGITLALPSDVFFLSPNGEVSCYNACTFPNSALPVGISKGSASVDAMIDPSGRIY